MSIWTLFVIVAVVGVIGYTLERWSWSGPLAVLCFAALIIEAIARAL